MVCAEAGIIAGNMAAGAAGAGVINVGAQLVKNGGDVSCIDWDQAADAAIEGSAYGAAFGVGAAWVAARYSASLYAGGVGGSLSGSAALEAANAAQAAGRTSGVAAELRVGGKVYTAVSTGGASRILHPKVVAALNKVPQSQRAPWHGHCAEPGCISQALDEGMNLAGAVSTAVRIRAQGSAVHGTLKDACSSCAALLEQFGIRY